MRSHTTKLVLAAIAVSVSARKIIVTVEEDNTTSIVDVPDLPDPALNLANDRSRLYDLEPGVCESLIVERSTEDEYLLDGDNVHELVKRETIGCYDVCSLEGGKLVRVEPYMANWMDSSFSKSFITEALAPGSVHKGIFHDGGHHTHSYHCLFKKGGDTDFYDVVTG